MSIQPSIKFFQSENFPSKTTYSKFTMCQAKSQGKRLVFVERFSGKSTTQV